MTGQMTGHLMPAKRPSNWPVVGLMTGQSALAAGVHCPVALYTPVIPFIAVVTLQKQQSVQIIKVKTNPEDC